MADNIRLSGKEVSGLPGRVFGSASMPAGAIGRAAEGVEFLELTGQQGLEELDRDKEALSQAVWCAPTIVEEDGSRVTVDGGASPVPYYFAVLADWLVSMTIDSPSAEIVFRGGTFRRYLHVIPYLLARRGLNGIVSENKPAFGDLSFATVSADGWAYFRAPFQSSAVMQLPLDTPMPCSSEVRLLAARHGDGGAWLEQCREQRADFIQTSSSTYSRTKTEILRSGWEIDPQVWASLMTFADRSLIKTSERSRLGAG